MKHSPEEARAWRAKMNALAREIRSMSPEARAKVPGILTCEGHALSPFNVCYLYHQTLGLGTGAPTMVGGFRQWQKVGRMVSEGEHAIGYIFVPMGGVKSSDPEREEESAVHFRLVPVFDVMQTKEITQAPAGATVEAA
jgi:hypothetical protein